MNESVKLLARLIKKIREEEGGALEPSSAKKGGAK